MWVIEVKITHFLPGELEDLHANLHQSRFYGGERFGLWDLFCYDTSGPPTTIIQDNVRF